MLRRMRPFDDTFDIWKTFDVWRDFDDLRRTMLEDLRLLPVEGGLRRMLPAPRSVERVHPAVECFVRDKDLVFRAELPGIDPAQMEVSVLNGNLVLKGEKKEDRKVEEKEYLFQEILRGRFERTFALPEGVKLEGIKGTFTNGVLEIVLPAAAPEAVKKVPVEVVDTGKRTVKAA